MIFQITINPIMALLETIFFVILLFGSFYIIYKFMPKKSRVNTKVFNRSAGISCLITLGIIVGIKILLQILEQIHPFFIALSQDQFLFAIMIILFTLFYRLLVVKQSKQKISKEFKKWNYIFLILYLILSIMFLSIDLLDLLNVSLFIEPLDRSFILLIFMPEIYNEIFYLGFLTAFVILFSTLTLTYFINKIRDIEKRIPKHVLKKTMITSGFISYFVWSYQLFIFGVYLGNFFNIGNFELDIRIQILILIGTYMASFLYFLKYKYLPAGVERSKERVEEANILLKDRSRIDYKEDEKELVIEVKDLKTYFYTEEGVVKAIEGISFEIFKGEILGLVGETGCGKSVTALSLQKLIPLPGIIEEGEVIYKGEDLLKKTKEEILEYRGKEITMIFQDPLNSLNPVFNVGQQISEVYLLNMEDELIAEALKNPNKNIYGIAREWSEKMLNDLNIPSAKTIYDLYPHELSGGMRQRIQIAMALACSPKLLIADEPTTALDVTVQNQILKLMKNLLKEYDTSILFITHDLGIISKMCDKVAVMYSGYIVEYGKRNILFKTPYHPYTRGLMNSIPKIGETKDKLEVIPGTVPNLIYPPSGCRFHPRCNFCFEPCDSKVPKSVEVIPNYFVACHLYDPEFKNQAEISIKKVEEQV